MNRDDALKLALDYFKGDSLAAGVYLDKYALTNSEGDILEPTPTEMHKRLAKEFARIEKKYPNPLLEEEIFGLLDKFEYIIPQGSPMSGMGNPYQIMSLSNCFVAGTKVFTTSGIKNIEDVEIGDETVTHNGRLRKVKQKHKNPLNGRTVFQLKTFRTPTISVTGNHKFMSISAEQLKWNKKPQFNSVEYLRVGDYIQIPNNSDLGSTAIFDSKEIFGTNSIFEYGNKRYKVIYSENKDYVKLATISKENKLYPHAHLIPAKFVPDEDFAYFLGLWYGDGCIFGENSKEKIQPNTRNRKTKISTSIHGITFTFGSHENQIIDFVTAYLSKLNISYDKNENHLLDGTVQIVIHSPVLGYMFEYWFGRRFDGKKLHSSIYSWPKNLVEKLTAGLIDSDGTITKSGDVRVAMSNQTLISSFYHLLRSRGIFVGISQSEKVSRLDFGRNLKLRNESKKTYSDNRILENLSSNTNHSLEIDGNIFTQILSKNEISCLDEFVYTLGIEEDHSYDVEGLVSLNCFVIDSPADSYGGILKADQEEAQIMKRRGGVGFDISTIRPRGLKTSNAAKTTDGIGVFMERFSNTCREVAQGGRRGALMLSISVHHPEIETFINIKRDKKKVTGANISIRLSDEFMKAVKEKKKYQLRFPVDSENPTITKMVSAENIWNQIIESAHESAEPGLLFWDTVKDRTPTECYSDFKSTSTNPCFSENTLIAVADGRGTVKIKDLAEAGSDIPVYSVEPKTGAVSIKMARNPRITGTNQKLVRVTLDDGSFFDVTPNHKCLLLDGSEIEAKDLKYGDSLPRYQKDKAQIKKGGKDYYRIHTNVQNHKNNLVFEHRLISQFYEPEKWNLMNDEAKGNGWIKGGIVVHHKDYNGLNNSISNLQIMTFKEHQNYHATHDNCGENNGRAFDVTKEEIKEKALLLTNKLGRRFSLNEWQSFAKENNLPLTFSLWRRNNFFNSPLELAKACAIESGFEYYNLDPRLVKSLNKMLEQGYQSEIVGNQVLVNKNCETCKQVFQIQHNKREISFCSKKCSLEYVNSKKEFAVKRIEARNKNAKLKAETTTNEQAKIYSLLKFKLSREPKQKEWENACKELGVAFRVGKALKYGFQTWKQVKKAGDSYNHKVVSVKELEGLHSVYNLTVDDNHTVAIVTDISKNKETGVFVAQCGEIILSPYDSCRLLLVNVLSFIENPFTEKAYFDSQKFRKVSRIAQRLMDDIVDLELEQIDKILAKIDADPEDVDVKAIERKLWEKIRKACVNGRRTGTGVTAIGDAVAAMNLRYGSEESVEFVEMVYRELAVGTYSSTIELAKERGPFPAFDYNLEKDHGFLNQVISCVPNGLENWKKYGRRNIALTTTAPAGTVSVMTQTTSGIEPAFEVVYKRRRKIMAANSEIVPDFIDDLGDKWQEYEVYHHQYKKWMEITGKKGVENSPYWKARANDIDWVAKVKVQAAAQKWICHSISNTTNVPNETTVDVVKDIYMTGWETGCKGVTIYRDGSRSGVLITESSSSSSNKETKPGFIDVHAPKRPTELMCEVVHTTVNKEKWTFFVGKLEDRPYEIMGGLSKYITIPKRIKTGKIVKHNGEQNPVARYDFHYDFDKGPEDEVVIKDINTIFENTINAAFTRTVSLALRHGTPVRYVVEQLLKGAEKDDNMFSFSKAISRVLKNYIQDGIKVANKKCSNCNSTNLAYQEGCLTCLDCGHSKCG